MNSTTTPTISLCMIIKNEAESLAACLESVKDLVDEIIIVDTGSTDQSVQIAASYGAGIIPYRWNNNFATARNAALEAATGKWILFLDGDEELDEHSAAELRLCTSHTEYDGFFVRIHNHIGVTKDSPNSTINPVLRIFRSSPHHRFEGSIHEQIASSITKNNPHATFHLSAIVIHHYGYADAIVNTKDKIARNVQLLQKELEQSPHHSFHHFNMGVEQMRMGEYEQALHHLQCSLETAESDTSYLHLIHKYQVRCLYSLGKVQEALKCLEQSTTDYPDYTDLWHIKGAIQFYASNLNQACANLKKAAKLGPAAASYHTEDGIGSYMTFYLLGRTYEGLGRDDEAINWYISALEINPRWLIIYQTVARLLKVNQRYSEIQSLLLDRLMNNSPELLQPFIHHLIDECNHEVVKSWLHQHKKFTSHPMLKLNDVLHDLQASVLWFTSASPMINELSSRQVFLGISYGYRNGHQLKALQLTRDWQDNLTSSPSLYRTWLTFADTCLSKLPAVHPYHTIAKQIRLTLPLPKE